MWVCVFLCVVVSDWLSSSSLCVCVLLLWLFLFGGVAVVFASVSESSVVSS